MNEHHASGSMYPESDGYSSPSAHLWTDEERLQYDVACTLRTMEDAKKAGVVLSLGKIAVLNGLAQPSTASRVVDTVRHALPLVKKYQTKMDRVRQVQSIREKQEDDEAAIAADLDSWIDQLSGAELRSVRIIDLNHGDPYMSPLSLSTENDDGASRMFPLGHSFGVESQKFASLPDVVRERLYEREEFWRGFGVETGGGVEEFIATYFEKIELFTSSKRVEELEWLAAAYPEAYTELRQLQAETGRKMYMWRLTKSPTSTVEDVLRIAINTQNKYVSTWLEPWMKRQRTPVILDSDVQAMQVVQQTLRDKLANTKHTKRSALEQAVLLAQLERDIAADADFNGSLTNMQRLRSIALGLEIEGSCTEAQRLVMDEANARMDEDLSGEKVADRLMIDTVLHTSEGITQSLKALLILLPVAEALTWVPISFIAAAAKATGCTDDAIAEFGEMVSLHAQGFKWDELKNRLIVVLPIAVVAVAVGTQIESIGHYEGERLAALLFALTTFATTAATLGLNVHSFSKGYMRLAEQGKLLEKPYLDADQRAAFKAAVLDDATDQAIRTRLDPFMEALANSPAISQRELEKRLAAIEAAARAGFADMAVQKAVPTRREALVAAYTEVFGVNPVRTGKLAAMPLMLGAAAVTGGALLSTPFVYVPFGMGETLGGLSYAGYRSKTEKRRWRTKVRDYTERARESHEQGSSALS